MRVKWKGYNLFVINTIKYIASCDDVIQNVKLKMYSIIRNLTFSIARF